MTATADYAGQVVFFFENGKAAKAVCCLLLDQQAVLFFQFLLSGRTQGGKRDFLKVIAFRQEQLYGIILNEILRAERGDFIFYWGFLKFWQILTRLSPSSAIQSRKAWSYQT